METSHMKLILMKLTIRCGSHPHMSHLGLNPFEWLKFVDFEEGKWELITTINYLLMATQNLSSFISMLHGKMCCPRVHNKCGQDNIGFLSSCVACWSTIALSHTSTRAHTTRYWACDIHVGPLYIFVHLSQKAFIKIVSSINLAIADLNSYHTNI